MRIEVKALAGSSEKASKIRSFVCGVQNGSLCKNENPLPKLNVLLDELVDDAFKKGCGFAKKHPDLET